MKSQPTAPQFPVMPLTLTLMWFSLDRLAWGTGWVMWHYKCLFIKLSPQVILLGSCVFVHYFSLCFFFLSFPPAQSSDSTFFRDTPQMSLFLLHFYVTVLCQQKETFIDFVSGCTEKCELRCRCTRRFTTSVAVNSKPQLKTFPPVLSARFNKLPPTPCRIRMKAALSSLYNNGWTVVNIGAAQARYV